MGINSSKEPQKSQDDMIKQKQLEYLEKVEKKRKQDREEEEKRKAIEIEQQKQQISNFSESKNTIENITSYPKSRQISQTYQTTINDKQNILNEVNKDEAKIEIPEVIQKEREVDNTKIEKSFQEIQESKPEKKDKTVLENNLISKIFKISFELKEDFVELIQLKAQYESLEKPLMFRLEELDEYMLEIINNSSINKKIIENFLIFYSRAYTMMEIKHRDELDRRYDIIRKTIASYLALIIISPENFGVKVSEEILIKCFTDYYNDSENDEFDFLINDIFNSLADDNEGLKKIFSYYIFGIFHDMNIKSQANFFQCDKIKNHITTITRMINDHSILRKLYTQSNFFRPKHLDGKLYQSNSLLGYYFNLISFECPNQNLIKTAFGSVGMKEADIQLRSQNTKMQNYITLPTNLLDLLLKSDESSEETFGFIYDIISKNYDRQKSYYNQYTTSSNGFLLNFCQGLIKILFEKLSPNDYEENSYSSYSKYINIFYFTSQIDLEFGALCKNELNLEKFERINQSYSLDYLKSEKEKINSKQYNSITRVFFSIHAILGYFLKNLETEYTNVLNQLGKMFSMMLYNDPKTLETFAYYRSFDVYLKSPEFTKNLVTFAQLTCLLIISLNNKKYNPKNNTHFIETDLFNFNQDFYEFIDKSDILELSMLPNFLVKNVLQIVSLLRKSYSDIFIDQMNVTRTIIYFAIIYSSDIEMIQNPHLRSELLEIILGLLIVSPEEKNMKGKINSITKLLSDGFISENLISALIQIFIDAERLGTQNQFFEKFNIRHKILYLIENIMKTHHSQYIEKIREYAIDKISESTKMINNLMNDLTYLIDECIEKLSEIKNYQDLLDDKEKFAKLDEETKQLENEKFANNDRIVKSELQLMNSSIKYLVLISENCQNTFMNLRLAERLAFFLNYSLDVFTSKRGLKIKIKNMTEYGFDPKFILTSIVTIYSSFVEFPEFIEFVVKDQRAYKIDNFEKVLDLKENNKIHIQYNYFSNFTKFFELSKQAFEEFKQKCIDYDDAPEEYLDSLTSELMENPVLLPDSKMILDRVTIETHLLSDNTDPFNRSKLTKDMLIECLELKEKIQEYKKSKIKKKE